MDREVREPLDADGRDRARARHDASCRSPGRSAWASASTACMDLRATQMRVFAPGEDRSGGDDEILAGLDNPALRRALRRRVSSTRRTTSSWCAAPRRRSTREAFLAGQQTPVFFGSAINNFGVREVLDALVDLAPPPGDRASRSSATVAPDEPKFTGVVFKIQANMDPAHRDRDRLRARVLGPLRARHAAEGRAHRQGAPARTSVVSLPVAAPRAARRGLRRRHHRHPEPRRAAARRHADRRRGAAVHRPAVLRAGAVPHASRSPTRCAPSSCAPA